ncbi:hypothetical protein Q2T40_06155 [Winogradskyella maritima]|uniref:Calx-beta domain-containing protein n=1 Tax=Winogradskyella maritima TaxID=1517766 RepID=A0ABV8AMI5_9FLAO|nr:hypothetical protein [Winogradskyella maritima]
MKNIIKYISLSIAACFIVACEEDNDVLLGLDTDSFVQFSDYRAVSVVENSGDVIEVTAILGGPQSQDVTVNFNVDGGAGRYSLSSTSVSIPAGQTSGTVTFTAIDDDDINGDVDIVISLDPNSTLPVGIAGAGGEGSSKTITIIDDNVPCNDYLVSVTTDRWGSENSWEITDSSGAVVASDGPYQDGPAGFTATYDTMVTLADGCYTFTMFDSYGDGMGTGTYSVACGSLVAASGGPDLANGNSSESTDFCVNQ